MRNKKSKKRLIFLLFIFVFMLSVSSFALLFTSNYSNLDADLETSTTNYLFRGKEYDITLDDVYDDENNTKIYTGANFQTVFLENESTILNETVSPVNNTNYKSPSNTDVSMIDGTFDDTDNMRLNDDSNSEFTSTISTPASEGSPEYIDSITYDNGWYYSGTLASTQVDDGNYYRSQGADGIEMNLLFDPSLAGRDFYISMNSKGYDRDSQEPHFFKVNGITQSSGDNIDFDHQPFYGVNTLELDIGNEDGNELIRLYFFKIEEIDAVAGVPAELNYTIDLNFSEVDTSKLLGLDVSSYHYTNISTNIIGKIYNYESSSYTQMFSSSNTVETENYFTDDTSITDYLNPSGNLKLYFTGTNENDFKQIIDYIKVRFYYKMDLTHTISFETNGLWKYRWELIGSLHYTDWTYFEVVDPVPNFHAISESDMTTRWILQNASITAVEDFHDDINTDYWNLIETSNIDFDYSIITTGDSQVVSTGPDNNFGHWLYFTVYHEEGALDRAYLKFTGMDSNYLFENQTGTNEIGIYVYNRYGTNNYELYTTTTFSEGTITWNNAPVSDTLQDTISIGTNGWKYFDISNINDYYMIQLETESGGIKLFQARSKEYGSLKPTFIQNDISKNYFGSGYMYMQTDTTETIGLKSPDYGTHKTLSSGDYFEVDFQTSSDSKIELILLKDGVVNKTLTLSGSGNTNFDRHTIQISISEELEFDQLKISSTFEDTDNIKVYDIKTYKYTIVGDYADFWVGSKRDGMPIYLTPDVYNLRIIESDIEVINENITIPETGIKQYVYIPEPPISKIQCRLTLFPIDGILSLSFTDYITYINRSYNGIYSVIPLVESIFYADELTIVYISVYDRFDSLIGTFPEPIDDFINLEIEVYQLEIINLMEQKTTIDINGSLYESELASGRWIDFMLSRNYYQIGYNDMDNDYHQLIIYLDSNQVCELNHSKICFLSYADQQGNHLSFDNYKTYINGSMIYEQIFYEDAGDDVLITITDRYDYEIYEGVYSVVSDNNFIPITLTMYSLKIMNQQEVFNHVNITRDPNDSGYFWSEWIAPGERIEFKLFAGDYVINLTDTENGWSSYGYELNGDDTLLFSSDNIISNVLLNIANTNTTIGNLITYVQIDLTTQNSQINSSILSIVINIESINSTLGDLLIDIDTAITNIESSIISEIVDMGVQITNVNSSLSDQILTITTDISNLDSSITSQFLTLGVAIENINGSIIDQILLIGVNISNVQTFLNDQILNIGVDISNLDTSITNQITSIISSIENVNTTLSTQISSLSSDIINVNSSIIGQMVALGVNITNVQTVITDQLLLLEVDITNINASIIEQILLVIADIENIETVIDDQTLVILSDITNVNSTLLNQMSVLGVNITNINATITNQILMLNVDLTNINSTITTMLTNIGVSIINMDSFIGTFFTFTNNSFINLNTNMNNSFIYIENNIISINQTISTLVIGIDNRITVLNGTITMMFTEMNQQFIITQSTLDYSFTFLNQTLIQLANDIEDNQIVLYNLIEQRANDIDSNLIDIQTLINLVNNTVADESLVIQTLVNIIGANISENHIIINTLLNLIDNNITNNNIQLVSILELIGNNITTNQFILETLINVIGNNITENYIGLLTNLNLINTTIGTNQIELINRILFINSTISDLIFELTNQIFFINDTIYTAVLDVSTSLEFGVNCVLGNISLTYQQNEFLTELYKKTMFSQLLNWSDVAYNYTLMEDRIDVWDFINNYKNDSITVFLRYGDLIDNLTITAQNSIEQYLPNTDVEYRLWSEELQEYIGEWTPLPENKTVSFGFFEADVPITPRPLEADFYTFMAFIIIIAVASIIMVISWANMKSSRDETPEETRLRHKRKRKVAVDRKKGYIYDHT